MDILKIATDWAKEEAFSSTFFILFGLVFIAGCIGFWQLGKTDLAKAYIYPTLIAGTFLMVAGVGLYLSNKARVSSFETEYRKDATAFIDAEIVRADKVLKQYKNIAFTVFPFIVVVASLLLVFMDKPLWRAISITIIATMVVIFVLDSNANARHKVYKEQLLLAKE